MPYETVDLRIEDGVAEITLNRPQVLNAFDAAVVAIALGAGGTPEPSSWSMAARPMDRCPRSRDSVTDHRRLRPTASCGRGRGGHAARCARQGSRRASGGRG